MTEDLQHKFHKALEAVEKAVLGKDPVLRQIMLAILAGGHILLEDIPGVGKTTAAVSFARVMGLQMNRVQFTPDVMPADLTGFSVPDRETGKFIFREGSLFTNLLLADELNRTSPRTQSALLEAMEERQVSVEGETRKLPEPFIVIATENTYGSAGTQAIPESERDRFMISCSFGYPDYDSELALLSENPRRGRNLKPILDEQDLLTAQREVSSVFMNEEASRYLLNLVRKTREHPDLAGGAGPRGSLSLASMARASAWFEGRDYVIPSDIQESFSACLSHRVALTAASEGAGLTKEGILGGILRQTKAPGGIAG